MERRSVGELTNKKTKTVNGSIMNHSNSSTSSRSDRSRRRLSNDSTEPRKINKRFASSAGGDAGIKSKSSRAIKGHRVSTPAGSIFIKLSTWHRAALLIVVVVVIPLLTYSSYRYYVHLLEGRIARPLDEARAVSREDVFHDATYHWGTYRPGVYFGLKTRRERSPIFGVMWFSQRLIDNQLPIRHQCEMGDFDQRYTWLQHDGQNFGCQEIHDEHFVLKTSFVKRPGGRHGGDWTARFSLLPTSGGGVASPVSLLFYAALDGEGRLDARVTESGYLEAIAGLSDATGAFQVTFHDSVASNVLMRNHLITVAPGLDVLKEVVLGNLAYHMAGDGKTRYIGLVGEQLPRGDKQSPAHVSANFVVQQVTVIPPFEMDVAYQSTSFVDRPSTLVGSLYTETMDRFRSQFDSRFEEVFRLSTVSNRSEDEIAFAKAAFSNLVGGIGYFSGHSLVQGEYNREAVAYFGTQLFTSVPSRSFFPRGFLWDEGFHNLLIGRFNPNITKDIVAHWLDTMNIDGWIPREQILDRESRARVPSEFVVQRDSNANPPTLFLPLREIVKGVEKKRNEEDVAFLGRIYPRLKVWFDWFNRTQVGKLPGTYRWRGRNADNSEELNPITLTSGLDDYPRASHPTEDERHVDLRCWIAFAAGVLASIARILGEPHVAYAATWAHLSDNRLLDELHWSYNLQSYADYGLHSNKVKLVKIVQPRQPSTHGHTSEMISTTSVRLFSEEISLQYVDAHGYVSLFPFLLRILDPDSEKLGLMLERLSRVDLLWTEHGLRSLAKTSSLYQKSNRPDSPPYWRGAIWINMNYLAVEALAHYGRVLGPHRQKSRELYYALRKNLVRNLHAEYKRTGYIWEQYNDTSGRGQRAHPFTGWSSLITLIMSDRLDDDQANDV